MENKKVGYYIVKTYNHIRLQVMYWNGKTFYKFDDDPYQHDEIESFTLLSQETLKALEQKDGNDV